jgi:putative chitobiose transport system permease protein
LKAHCLLFTPPAIAKPKQSSSLASSKTIWKFVGLPTIVLVIVFLIPALASFVFSLFTFENDLYHPVFVGLANYQALFQNGSFLKCLLQTFLLGVVIIPSVMIIPLGIASIVVQPFWGSTLVRLLVYSPVMISMVVSATLWKWVLQEDGLLNGMIQAFGGKPVAWLTDPNFVLGSIATVVVWKALGYYMMMYVGRLQTLSPDWYEAASIEGATAWQQFWYITLPQLRPTMVLVVTISSLATLKLFSEIYVLTKGGPLHNSETLVFFIYDQAFGWLNLGTACAAGLLFAGLIIGVMAVQETVKYQLSRNEAKINGGIA